MQVGFDAKRYFQNNTGLGNYSRTLVQSLVQTFPEESFILFSSGVNQSDFKSENLKNVNSNKSLKAIWRSFGISKSIQQENVNIFHGLSNEIPFSLKHLDVKKVVTMHDLIFKHFPNQYPIIDRSIYNIKSKYACMHSDIIIATSESTKKDIENFYQIKSDKIKVVYQSCDPVFREKLQSEKKEKILNQYQIPKEFILYVGSFNERKNVQSIVEAYKKLPYNSRIPCVCIGYDNSGAVALKKTIYENKLESSFIFLHQIETNHLPAFYQSALCFLYPSLYEGFGIPILEALYSDCPILTSNISSLPELAGDAAIYFNPTDVEEIAEAMLKITTESDLRNTLIEQGKARIHFFFNKNPTQEVMQIYKELM